MARAIIASAAVGVSRALKPPQTMKSNETTPTAAAAIATVPTTARKRTSLEVTESPTIGPTDGAGDAFPQAACNRASHTTIQETPSPPRDAPMPDLAREG